MSKRIVFLASIAVLACFSQPLPAYSALEEAETEIEMDGAKQKPELLDSVSGLTDATDTFKLLHKTNPISELESIQLFNAARLLREEGEYSASLELERVAGKLSNM